LSSAEYFAHSSAIVDDGCQVGAGTKIWHFSHIMPGCIIGNNCNIGQNVVISPKVVLGNNVRIQNNVSVYEGVICEDDVFLGPSMVFTNVINPRSAVSRKHEYLKTWVKKGASIGANATIDRATIGSTLIKSGAKLDNLVQIAHNVEIGEHTVIAAQAGVAGSTHIGARCMIGGQVGFAGHLKIADGSKFQAQSGIAQSIVETNQAYMGSPAFNYRQYQRSFVVFKQLPELATQVRELKQKIEEWGK